MKCRSVKPKPCEVRLRRSVLGPCHEKGSSSGPREPGAAVSFGSHPSFCLAWKGWTNRTSDVTQMLSEASS